jgi:hypothetical protein
LNAYSGPFENREIVLTDVSVYTTDTSEQLYDVPGIYLTLIEGEYSIEKISEPQESTNGEISQTDDN